MTDLLEKAFAEATKLSDQEQNALAAWIIEEIESERRWADSFANSADALEELADEALEGYRKAKGIRFKL